MLAALVSARLLGPFVAVALEVDEHAAGKSIDMAMVTIRGAVLCWRR